MNSLLLGLTLLTSSQTQQSMLPTSDNSLPLGTGVERTISLLTTSSVAHPNRVRILFYGQSISDENQVWPKLVVEALKKKYPNAIIEDKNLAIGGFAADLLQWTAIDDFRTWNPDLVIFHDYGGEPDYEHVIKNMMANSHADLLLQSDLFDRYPTGDADRAITWHNNHAVWLKDFATKKGYGMVDVRHHWFQHCEDNHLVPKVLTRDGIHPNDQGGALMASIVLNYLKPSSNQRIKPRPTQVTIKPTDWQNGHFGIVFLGHRVEIALDSPLDTEVAFKIDGKKPSEHPESYYNTRPTNAHQMWFPIISNIRIDQNAVAQEFTLTISNPKSPKDFDFKLVGAKTGPEGSGNASRDFLSNSKRIRIDSARWTQWYGNHTPPEGMIVKWNTVFEGADSVNAPNADGTPVVIASGLSTEQHTLRLSANQIPKVPIKFIVYPPNYK